MNFPTKQGILAYLYSLALSAWNVLTAMALTGYALGSANGGFNDWPAFVTFLSHTWFVGILGLVFAIGPYARYAQAKSAASGNGTQPPPEQAPKGTP
jgi:hypothetical protein